MDETGRVTDGGNQASVCVGGREVERLSEWLG